MPTKKKVKRVPRTIAQIKRHRTARLASLGARCIYLSKRGKEQKMYALICDEFISLGGVYIKFLQGILLRSPRFKSSNGINRLKVFENLDSEPLDIHAILHTELGPRVSEIALIQPQPFAAGSFGQVYYGQHRNGKPIIVKVLRPMVRELLKYDLKLLSTFSKQFMSTMYPNMQVETTEAVKEFRDATLRETDYISEAQFADEMYQTYRNHPTFIIPETFLDLCTPNIIVQEYIDGISAAQLVKLKEQSVDPKQYVEDYLGSDLDIQLETLGIELLCGAFNLPRIQGDPHPGNVRFMRDNKVGLIDFGIFAHSPQNKGAFYGMLNEYSKMYNGDQSVAGLFEQLIRFFVNDLYRALKKLSSITASKSGKVSDFTKDVGRIAQDTFSHAIGVEDIRPMLEDGSIMKTMNKVVNRDNRFGLVMKLEATELLRAAQTYASLVESLDRQRVVLKVVYAEAVDRVRRGHPEVVGDSNDNMSMAHAVETVTKWLERVAERDPALFRQLMAHIKVKPEKVQVVPEEKPIEADA